MIGDADPVGICGSGLVDAVAELVACGLLDHSGRFVPDEDAAEAHPVLSERLVKRRRASASSCSPGAARSTENAIYLSQRDVRELQFAKASIATGWMILVSELGITAPTSTGAARRQRSARTCPRRAPFASASCPSCR